MTSWRRLLLLLPWRRRAVERDMQEELSAIAALAGPRELGNLTQVAEDARAEWSWQWLDQLKQDQTIGISYSESNGQRSAGFQVWDRSDTRLSGLIEQLNAANRIQDSAEREKAIAKIRASAPPGPRRVFLGKNQERAATMALADEAGRPRLRLTVDAAGNPRAKKRCRDGDCVQDGREFAFDVATNRGGEL